MCQPLGDTLHFHGVRVYGIKSYLSYITLPFIMSESHEHFLYVRPILRLTLFAH